MYNPFLESLLTREFILQNLTQEHIFEYYTGCPVRYDKHYHAPHRKDPKASFSYMKKNGDIICKDFGDKNIKGDCFSYISYIKGCSYRDTFKIIANDFNLFGTELKVNTNTLKYRKEVYKDEDSKKFIPIEIKKIPWNKELLQFWLDFGWTKELLDLYEINPISHYWFNKELRTVNDICYAFRFAPYEYKLYFPFQDNYRFRVNTNRLQGFKQLDSSGTLCVLNKSLKDVGLLRRFGINSVATQAEGNLLNQKDFDELNSRFTKLISIYDFDYAGVTASGRLKRRYGIERTMLTNGRYGIKRNYGAKDLSDFYKLHGIEKFKQLIHYKFNKYMK